MTELKEYKCACCGGAIAFDSTSQRMKCPFCDTEFEVETLEAYDNAINNPGDEDMSWQTSAGGDWQESEESGLRVYVCKSCGGEIVADETTAASACPYCNNPVVMTGNLSGTLKPDLIIPFKLDKKAAIAALKKHYSGKRLLPKVFKDQNHIEEVKGVYVPFWLFDADASASIRYKGTRTRFYSDSRYDYEETSFYSIIREGSLSFEHIPVDGSTKIDDALMEAIEPYKLEGAVDFKTAYLAGYLADKYDVDANAGIERANERIKTSIERVFERSVSGYTGVIAENTAVRLSNTNAKYALLPVWLLNTTWKGEKYYFAMNAQTGRFVGDLPLDKAAASKMQWSLTALIGAAAFLVSYLMWLF
ncbi:MAG: hypothetical protein IJD67_03445 [Clostridia bacterium]|nr:hypothetical protein [Clostridia bacterium]